METFKEYLERHEACEPAIEYAASLNYDVKAVIENCPQADWLMWVVAREPETFGLTTHELVGYALKAAAWGGAAAAWASVAAAWSRAASAAEWAAAAAVRHAWNATEDHPELRAQLWELVEPLKAKIKNHFTKTI